MKIAENSHGIFVFKTIYARDLEVHDIPEAKALSGSSARTVLHTRMRAGGRLYCNNLGPVARCTLFAGSPGAVLSGIHYSHDGLG